MSPYTQRVIRIVHPPAVVRQVRCAWYAREGVGRLEEGVPSGQLDKSYFPEQLKNSESPGLKVIMEASLLSQLDVPRFSDETPRKAITQIQEIRAVIGFDSRRQIDYPHKGSAGHSPLSSLKGLGANPARISDATDLAFITRGRATMTTPRCLESVLIKINYRGLIVFGTGLIHGLILLRSTPDSRRSERLCLPLQRIQSYRHHSRWQ